MSVPLLIIGDAPFRPTGLSRILTDLLRGLTGDFNEEGAPHDFAHAFTIGTVGYHPWADLPRSGMPVPARDANGYMRQYWTRNWAFSDLSNHGREAVSTAYRAWFGDRPGILLSIWDPGRCHAFTTLDLPVEKWGYFAIDAANMNGGISGPAGLAVNSYDRVLAYTQFGKKVLETATDLPVEVLPHGIDLSVFTREMTEGERTGMIARLFPAGYKEGTLLLGCVATNQPRKDLGLFVQVLRELRARGHQIHGWLHTDRLISEAWSIPQLAADAGVEDHLTVTTKMTDRELAVAYSLCVATVAPGRGEGFGYPIVESLACGVPVLHCDYGGGAEFTPKVARIPALAMHLVGPYALQRPILDPDEITARVEGIIEWGVDADTATALRQEISYLDWPTLWPQWAVWFRQGLDKFQEAHNVR